MPSSDEDVACPVMRFDCICGTIVDRLVLLGKILQLLPSSGWRNQFKVSEGHMRSGEGVSLRARTGYTLLRPVLDCVGALEFRVEALYAASRRKQMY